MRAGGVAVLLWWAVAVLALGGLAVSTYLTALHFTGGVPACGVGGGCEEVTTSRYAYFLGVPVAVIGMAGYTVLLLWGMALAGAVRAPRGWAAGLTAVAGLGFAFSLYLTALQRFVIGAYCLYCLTSAAIMTVLFVLSAAALLLCRRWAARTAPEGS